MHKILSLFCLCFLLVSCASLKRSDIKPTKKKIATTLPTLDPRIDVSSFESAYSLGGSKAGVSAPTGHMGTIGISTSSLTTHKDPRVQDAITIFDREVKNNLTEAFGDKKGNIVSRIVFNETKKRGYGWSVLSWVSLGVLNILGMPYGTMRTALEAEVEIYDVNNRLVQKYNSFCQAKAWRAMYYGYSEGDAIRKSNIDAYKCVLDEIKDKISKDSTSIKTQLLQASP